MPAPNPADTEQFAESFNIKQLVDDSSDFRKTLNDIMVESVKTHQAVMSTISQSVASNQDMREKLIMKLLETGPVESASISTLLQQALKAAQSSQPETGAKPTPRT